MIVIDHEIVIENTLNFGVKSSMDRFSISYEEVKQIVKPFTDEIDDGIYELCGCQRASRQGIQQMCWACDMPNNKIRNIKWE